MDFNEFNKELQNRISDSGTRYILGLLYERQLDVARQVDANNEVLLALVQTIQNVVGLNEILDGRVQELNKLIHGRRSDAEFESVPLTNDDV
jgi:hypothetical protein